MITLIPRCFDPLPIDKCGWKVERTARREHVGPQSKTKWAAIDVDVSISIENGEGPDFNQVVRFEDEFWMFAGRTCPTRSEEEVTRAMLAGQSVLITYTAIKVWLFVLRNASKHFEGLRLLTDEPPKDNLAFDMAAVRDGAVARLKYHFARAVLADGKPMLENKDQIYFYERQEPVANPPAEG